jgi:hypothetical protein
VLRPVLEVEGALSAMGAVVDVGVAVEGGIEDDSDEDVALKEAEDVALVLLDEAEDEDIDAGVTVVSAFM